MKDKPHSTRRCRCSAQLAELTRLVGRLHQVAERHNAAIQALEVGFAHLARQAQRDRDLDDGLLDVPPAIRRGLRALDTTKREG